jgi:hypothetical protein
MVLIRLLLVLLLPVAAFSQPFARRYDVPVSVNDGPLRNAWAGGLNSGQFSKADLDFDGHEDLIVFDRIGNRLLTYLNDGEGNDHYTFTIRFNHLFPADLRGWVLMHDFNCDGKKDIFTNFQSGLKLFKNTGDATNGLSFEPVNGGNLIQAHYDFGANAFDAPLYAIGIDMPSIDDYDDDGDMDIFSYTELGTTVYWFKSMQVENGDCETPDYECVNRCYGMFNEASESFLLSTGDLFFCDFNMADPREASERMHIGSSLLQLELDGNGIKDLVLGDVSEPNMAALLMMNAEDGQDSTFSNSLNFPWQFGASDSVNMPLFPAAFYEDLDNDGVPDLVVSPNASAQAADQQSVWYFKNTGSIALPSFQLIRKNFLQNEQIDLGWGAYPVVVDVDMDGLKDIVVSNRLRSTPGQVYTSRMWWLRNVGTPATPAFVVADENWLDIPSREMRSVYPAFGDVDQDGDTDMLLGDEDGFIHLFRNSAGAGAPLALVQEDTLENAAGFNIDPGQNATPQLIDLDEDGLSDLIVGEKNGNINYYRNSGSNGNPQFTLQTESLGNVIASNYLGVNGYSVPHFFKNTQGQWELFLGTETGVINHYSQISGNLTGSFTLLDDRMSNIREGDRSAPFLADLDNDGLRDLLYGQSGGGLAYYQGVAVGLNERSVKSFDLFPNPTSGLLTIAGMADAEFRVFDLTGRCAMAGRTFSVTQLVDVSALSRGVYVFQLTTKNGMASRRFIRE